MAYGMFGEGRFDSGSPLKISNLSERAFRPVSPDLAERNGNGPNGDGRARLDRVNPLRVRRVAYLLLALGRGL